MSSLVFWQLSGVSLCNNGARQTHLQCNKQGSNCKQGMFAGNASMSLAAMTVMLLCALAFPNQEQEPDE